MAKHNLKDQYFKVITSEGATEADILLYGVIGQDFWWDEDLKEESITDLEFFKTLRRLEANYDRINIRINSPGGSMYHGNAIISAIQSSKAEIHAFNDGMAASMAADIWLACQHRHMAKNALLMIHSPSSFVWGTAQQMREEAEVLDKFEQTIIAVMTDTTGMSEAEIKDQFYDYKDHWLTAKECKDLGFITAIEDYDVEDVMDDVQNLSYRELVKRFSEKNDQESLNWLEKLKQKYLSPLRQRTKAAIQSQKSIPDMKIEELKKSLEDKDLTSEQVAEVLKAQGYTVEKVVPAAPTAEPNTETEDPIQKAVNAAVNPIIQDVKELADALKKWSEQSGDTPTQVASTGDPYEGLTEAQVDAQKQTEAFNEQVVETAKTGQNIRISTT